MNRPLRHQAQRHRTHRLALSAPWNGSPLWTRHPEHRSCWGGATEIMRAFSLLTMIGIALTYCVGSQSSTFVTEIARASEVPLSGTLFHSDSERAKLERASLGSNDTHRIAQRELKELTVAGVVKRSDNRTVVWIDGDIRLIWLICPSPRNLSAEAVGNPNSTLRIVSAGVQPFATTSSSPRKSKPSSAKYPPPLQSASGAPGGLKTKSTVSTPEAGVVFFFAICIG